MSKKNEAGKFMITIAVVIGLALGSIYLLNAWVFKPQSHATTAKPPQTVHAEQPVPEETLQEKEPNPALPPVESTASTAPAAEPFYAKLKDGEYIGVWNQNGTEKQINLNLGTKEVKNLLGNPLRESYENGESTYLCYSCGKLAIYFEEGNQSISFMTYEDDDSLLQKQWIVDLEKTQDTGNVDFYNSPTGYTSVKVDHLPEQKRVIVYLQNQYGATEEVPSPNKQTQMAQEPKPAAAQRAPAPTVQNANGNNTMHPGEELSIEDWEVTNKSPHHSASYQIEVNYHFAYNNSNWVKVITKPEKKLELMPGETGTVQIKVKASKHAPKGSYRYIVSLKQGWQTVEVKEFTVEVQ